MESLKKVLNYIQDVNKQMPGSQLKFDLLHKKSGASIWGNFYYEQIIFLGQNKMSKHDRIKLALQNFLFEKIQGTLPGVRQISLKLLF